MVGKMALWPEVLEEVPMVQARLQALVLELHAAICLQGVSQVGFPQAGEVPAVKVHFQVFSRGPVVVVCLSVVPRPVA